MSPAERLGQLIGYATDAQHITRILAEDPHRGDAGELRTRLRALCILIVREAGKLDGGR